MVGWERSVGWGAMGNKGSVAASRAALVYGKVLSK